MTVPKIEIWYVAQELLPYSPQAAVAWQNEARSRPVTLIEHDSMLVGLAALADVLSRPDLTGPPSAIGTILRNPYLTTQVKTAQGGLVVPVVGAFSVPPANADRRLWWDAVRALLWRVADLTTLQAPATGFVDTVYPDAQVVMLVGNEAVESTIQRQQVGSKLFKEHQETAANAQRILAGALAVAELAGAPTGTVATAVQTGAIAAGRADALKLQQEMQKVTARANVRGIAVAAVALAAAVAINQT